MLKEVINRPERSRVLRAGTIRIGGLERKVTVRDVSATGARLKCDVSLAVGEEAYLTFGEHPPVTATVRWIEGDVIGVQFHRAIELDENANPTAAALNRPPPELEHVSWRR
ncbi:MAG: PilZ domain-containing protein [Pacificimonas sp.]